MFCPFSGGNCSDNCALYIADGFFYGCSIATIAESLDSIDGKLSVMNDEGIKINKED